MCTVAANKNDVSVTVTARSSESLVNGYLGFVAASDNMPLAMYSGKDVADIASFKINKAK